jgi:hypothetical protein
MRGVGGRVLKGGTVGPPGHRAPLRRILRSGAYLATAAALAGCELNEVTIAEARDVVVAEVLVQVGRNTNRVTAFLHRTETGGDGRVPDADIRVTVNGRAELPLIEADWVECLVAEEGVGPPAEGTCYVASPIDANRLAPADRLDLEIRLRDGGLLSAQTVVAGDFELVAPNPPTCTIPPLQTYEMRWTSAPGAWAYVSETRIEGLSDALDDPEIEIETDPLDLLGVSVSAADTTIVFPAEFGLFDRFDLDRDLALVLQEGLPEGTRATVLVGAADRNWVNWVRGGNFNPSGQVRVPSVQGDGTGVFGSVVLRTARFSADPTTASPGLEPCAP